jgi:hypothetical protein
VDKLLQAGSIAIALFLIIGSVLFPDKTVMWLASTGLAMDVARAVLIAIMLGLLLSKPPRDPRFRALLGSVALVFGGWSVTHIFGGDSNILDAAFFLEAAVVFGVAALEVKPATRPQLQPELALETTNIDEEFLAVYEPYPEILRQVWPLLLFTGRRVIALAASSISASGLQVADYSTRQPGRQQASAAYRRLIPVVYTPP